MEGVMLKSLVLEHFGGTVKTASALGVSHSAVCQWSLIVPEKQALKIDRLTKGALKYSPEFYTNNNKTV